MSHPEPTNPAAEEQMRSIIQRIATGPELSKEISLQEARAGMSYILNQEVDAVRAGIFLIALRMKRETMDEMKGILDAIRENTDSVTADVDEVVDLADPYDGYNRSLPPTPFLAIVLAELGINAFSHGLDAVGPKYGITHRHVMQALGVKPDLTPQQAADRLADPAIGWAYVDQAQFCPKLHNLVPLRTKIVKRPSITTVEVLAKAITGRNKTHLITGYVHKPYPPIYAELARHVGFDSCLLIRGVEGGLMPSLRQEGKYVHYQDKGAEVEVNINPEQLGINQELRSVPLPAGMTEQDVSAEVALQGDVTEAAKATAEAGLQALNGKQGGTYDGLVYASSLILQHLGKAANLQQAADQVRAVLDSGKAAGRIC